jgi:broad specificity phosphatase PhoE
MIRHGQASFGQDNYDKLSDRGCAQAELLGKFCRNLGLNLDAWYTGTMQRHLETARHFCKGFAGDTEPVPSFSSLPEFNEYDPEMVLRAIIPELIQEDPGFAKDVENMFADKRSFQFVFEKAILRWVSGESDTPGLMTWEAYAGDVARGIRRIMAEHGRGKTIALFTSGGPISAAAQFALSLSNTAALQLGWQIINSSVTRFKFTADRIMMMTFNEHSHLEMEKQGSWITYR